MAKISFPELLFSEIRNHESNYFKVPKLARDAEGNYYLKEV